MEEQIGSIVLFDYVNNKGDNKESTIETISKLVEAVKEVKKKSISLFSDAVGWTLGLRVDSLV